MSEEAAKLTDVEMIFRKAIGCNTCFACSETMLQRGLVDIAQPRPIGEKYWTSDMRIVLVLLNPGAGNIVHARPNQIFNRLLHDYANGSGPLEPVFQHQREEMPAWGSGQFRRLYLDGYGLKLSEIATANVAWCAERSNKYLSMLAPCFGRHTLPLLRTLRPDVVVLAGKDTHVFSAGIQEACPNVAVVQAMHYRPFNCLAQEAKHGHLKDVRDQLYRIGITKRGCPPTLVPKVTYLLGKQTAKPRISTMVRPSNERLAELESKWHALGIVDQFHRVHHFSPKRRETLDRFVKYCDGKELRGENIQTLDRALDVACRVERGQEITVALHESLAAFPIIKM